MGDVEGPVISNVIATSVGENSAVIVWKTNEPATSQVVYGTTPRYGQSEQSSKYVTSHSITLTNLIPYTKYYFKVVSKDVRGNISAADYNYNFRTLRKNEIKDTEPPKINIISPRDGATVSGVTVIQAEAEDNVGIVRYELVINDEVKDTKFTSTNIYRYELDTIGYPTKLTIKITAYDAAGHSNHPPTSITVTVDNRYTWAISCKKRDNNCELKADVGLVGTKVFIVKAMVGADPLTLEPLISITIDGERNLPDDFIMWNVRPGDYYVCAYKDLNGDGIMTRGVDATGVYTKEVKTCKKYNPVDKKCEEWSESEPIPAIAKVGVRGGYQLKSGEYVIITEQEKEEYSFKLSIEKFKISGKVMRLGTVAEEPTPQAGASIEVRENPGTFVKSKSDGSFEITTPGIAGGGYYSLKAALKDYLIGNSETLYVTTNISNFNLVILSEKTVSDWGHTDKEKGFVYGIVKDKAGNRIAGATVIITPSSGKIGYKEGNKINYNATSTSTDGVFTIKWVEPISYEYIIYITHPNYSFRKKNIFVYRNQLTYVEFRAQ